MNKIIKDERIAGPFYYHEGISENLADMANEDIQWRVDRLGMENFLFLVEEEVGHRTGGL